MGVVSLSTGSGLPVGADEWEEALPDVSLGGGERLEDPLPEASLSGDEALEDIAEDGNIAVKGSEHKRRGRANGLYERDGLGGKWTATYNQQQQSLARYSPTTVLGVVEVLAQMYFRAFSACEWHEVPR
jgi:hypothetical protein